MMKLVKPLFRVSCAVAVMILAVFVSCKKNGPTDLSKLTVIVSSESGKDNMDIVHRSHEKAGITCEKCHHKFENPDRIKICSNCHRGDEKRIARDMCVKCHTENK
ncbi:MAG: hypothetical protein A2176_08625 [Spirochaetes bacterium RBG_13_51_14]|nr:MAG: hypothetical protein A2176_08625 [Spirochaetes bacterium RBG_13_51_14]